MNNKQEKMKIKEVTYLVLDTLEINTRKQLQTWCASNGRQKLYDIIYGLAEMSWNSIDNPKKWIRRCYQKKLTGYV